MNDKICTLCNRRMEDHDKAFYDEGQWTHLRCIKAKLNKLRRTGVNKDVIDFILSSFEGKKEAEPEKPVKKRFGFFKKA